MNIEVLYIPDCPGYAPTLKAINRIVDENHIAATVTAVEVANPNTEGFRGSPTVRIDGKDIEGDAGVASCGLACRTYIQASKLSNLPSEDMLRTAILRERRLANIPPAVAPLFAITAALASVACCLPFGIAGMLGTLGLSFYLESKRGWVIGAAAIFLALSVFQLYRQRKARGHVSVSGTVLLGVATLMVAAMIIAPDQVALLLSKIRISN